MPEKDQILTELKNINGKLFGFTPHDEFHQLTARRSLLKERLKELEANKSEEDSSKLKTLDSFMGAKI